MSVSLILQFCFLIHAIKLICIDNRFEVKNKTYKLNQFKSPFYLFFINLNFILFYKIKLLFSSIATKVFFKVDTLLSHLKFNKRTRYFNFILLIANFVKLSYKFAKTLTS